MKESAKKMRKYDAYRVRFDTERTKKHGKKKGDDSLDELRKIINRNSDANIDFADMYDTDFSSLKVLNKKKGIKAIMNGKVLNADRKKYRKWKKHDKEIIKEMISPMLQEMYDNDDIGYKKAKKLRKILTNRIISCFYGSED